MTLCSGDLRRRRGTALPGSELLLGQRPGLLACQPELRRAHSSTIQENWLIKMRPSTHRTYSHCWGEGFPASGRESVQLHLHIKMAICVEPKALFFSPHEPSDLYTSNREPNVRTFYCVGEAKWNKDGYFSAWSGEQGQLMCFLAIKARENSHCSWVLLQSSPDIGDIWIQACVLFLFNAYCRFAHLSPVPYWLFTRRRGKISKTLHCPDSLIRTSGREGERKVF